MADTEEKDCPYIGGWGTIGVSYIMKEQENCPFPMQAGILVSDWS